MTQMSKKPPATPGLAARRRRPLDAALDFDLLRALCDPTRARLLSCLAACGRACSVTEIAACCSVDFSVVSRHLSLLDRAGVVESSRRGREVLYRVRYASVSTALRALADAFDQCCPAGGGGCCG